MKQRKTPGWRSPSNWVENSFFRLSPSERNEKTHLGSNSTRSVLYHHFGLDLPSSEKGRVDEGLPVGLKTRFVEFPHQGETKKNPWDRIPWGRFHTTIFSGLLHAVQKAGLTKVVQLRWKLVSSSFLIGAKRKNTLGFEFHEVGFIPLFLLGFTKQWKTLGWRRSSNCVQNSFCRVSPSGRNEKTPLGSNSTRSVSYHHFCWALPSSGKRRVDEGRPIAFKTRFVEFPHRCQTKKHPWDRIPRGRFHTTILGGIYKGAENAGLTKVVQLCWKLVFSSFLIWANRKNTLWIEFHEVGFIPPFWVGLTKQRKRPGWRRSSSWVENSFCRVPPSGGNKKKTLGIEFHEVGFIPPFFLGFCMQCKKPGWRRLSNCVENSFRRVSPSGRNEKTPLGSNSTRSVSYHYFCWALPSSGKRWVDEGRPIAFKTRFVEFPHRGETKKHPWVRIPRGRFHTTIFAGLYQAAENAGLTKVVQLRSKLVLSSFPIGAKRKNTLEIEFHEVGFIPPFWVGFKRSGKRRVDEGRPIVLKTRFFEFPYMGESKKHPLDRIPRGRFYTTILGWTYQAAKKAGLTKVFQLGWKLVLSSSPIRGKQKKTLGIEFHEVGFIPPFFLGFCMQCKKPGWRRSSNCVENSFRRVSPSGRNEKTPLGSNSTRSVSYHYFCWVLPSSGKRWVDEGRPVAFKTRFVEFPHRGETKKHPWVRIPRGRFHTTIFAGLYQAAENAGLTKIVQLRSKLVLSSFPIGAKRKNTLEIEFHEVGFIPPFWVGFKRSGKRRVDEDRPIVLKTRFFEFPYMGESKKHPLDRIPRGRFYTTILGWTYQAAKKAGLTKVFQLGWKLVLSSSPIRGKQKKTLGIEFHEVGFIPPFFLGFCMQCKKPGWRRSSNCVENSFRRVSPSGRNEKTPLGSNSTRSVSYHYFCWALPSSGKRWVDEGRPVAFKTRFVEFPHRGETKKHPWVRIPRGRFHTTIFAGLYQAAENAGLTKVVQLRSKLVLSSFPIGAKRKNTLEIEFHEVGFIPPFWVGFTKERKTPGWRRSSNCVENSFFRVSLYGRIEKTPFGSNSTRLVSHHHFGWAFPSNAKSRVDEGRPIAFKTRFFDFPHRGETKKHPWVRIPGGRFHTPIFAGLYQAAENAGLTKVVQLRSKLVLSSFPIGAKRKNTLVIEFHEVGFIPPFWVGFSKQRKTPVWPRSSNWVENSFFRVSPSGRNEKTPFGSNSTRSASYHHFGWAFPSSAKRRVDEGRPIAFKTRFFDYPHRGKTKKHPWDRIPRGRFHTTILGWIYQVAENAGLTKVVQLRSKLFFLRFPIGAKRKNTLGIEFHEFGFKPQFWVGFCKQRKKPAV